MAWEINPTDLALEDKAVREGEEDAGGAEDGDQPHGEPHVGVVAVALVGEGRRQRLERQHRACRPEAAAAGSWRMCGRW